MKIRALIIITVFSAVLFSSCSREDIPVPVEESAYVKKMRLLDWGVDTCFVYGHKTPDVDAVTSALSYANLMRTLGYNCKAKVSSPMNRETSYIAGVFGFDLPELKENVVPQTRLILTDHTDYAQCVDGAKEAIILQKIDHHTEGDIKDANISYVRREMVGSTNTIIYKIYKEEGLPIDDNTARIMLAGIISDTRNLTKSTTKGIDQTALNDLALQLCISSDSVAILNRNMEEAIYDYSGMTDEEIFLSDYKDYDINGYTVGFGCVACKDTEMDAFFDHMLAVMPEIMQERDRQMLFLKIDKRVKNTGEDSRLNPYLRDGFYLVYFGEGTKEVAESIFGESVRENACYASDDMSRKQIIPLITDLLQ